MASVHDKSKDSNDIFFQIDLKINLKKRIAFLFLYFLFFVFSSFPVFFRWLDLFVFNSKIFSAQYKSIILYAAIFFTPVLLLVISGVFLHKENKEGMDLISHNHEGYAVYKNIKKSQTVSNIASAFAFLCCIASFVFVLTNIVSHSGPIVSPVCDIHIIFILCVSFYLLFLISEFFHFISSSYDNQFSQICDKLKRAQELNAEQGIEEVKAQTSSTEASKTLAETEIVYVDQSQQYAVFEGAQ